jgi:hypothetical protein
VSGSIVVLMAWCEVISGTPVRGRLGPQNRGEDAIWRGKAIHRLEERLPTPQSRSEDGLQHCILRQIQQ